MRKEKKSLAETHPEVAKQWHPTKNDNLLPEDIPHKVNYRLWWQCVVIASSSKSLKKV